MQRVFVLIIAVSFCFLSSLVEAEQRQALVIGNSNYQYVSKLENPRHDSTDMAQTLKTLSFEVTLLQDATREEMVNAIDKYIANLQRAGGTGLFYYAGHGVQLEGNNYLVPVETNVGSEQEIRQQSYSIANLLNGIRSVKTRTNIVILDACRDNPFKNMKVTGRSLGKDNKQGDEDRGIVLVPPRIDSGLSELDAPPNTLIAFATAPGRVASDGEGRNSPYTAELVRAMQNTGLTIAEVFRQVRRQVVKDTSNKQIPWESSSLIEDFYFKPRKIIPAPF